MHKFDNEVKSSWTETIIADVLNEKLTAAGIKNNKKINYS